MVAAIGHNNPPVTELLTETYAEMLAEIEPLADKASNAPKDVESEGDLAQVGDIVIAAKQLTKKLDKAREDEKRPYLDAGREIQSFFAAPMDRLNRIATALEARATVYQRKVAAEARRKAEEEARIAREEEERQREIARRAEEANRAKTAAKHDDKAEDAAFRAAQAEATAQASAADLTRTRLASGSLATARTEWAFEITDYNQIPLDLLRPYLARTDVEKALRSFVRVNRDTQPLAGVRIFEDVKARFR